MADQQDPLRRRFSDGSRETVERAEAATVQRVQTMSLSHKEIVERARRAMGIPNPSEVQHALHEIAIEARYRDSTAVVRLLIADQEYRRGCQGGSLSEIFSVEEEPIEYLIPGLLPKPGTLLIHGRGGCGKTMAVMTLAKHIARGLPFSVCGDDVPVEKGTVLWLNGDQNSRRIRKQFKDLDFTEEDPVVVQNKVSMLWYPWFIQQVEKHRPKLVVWDSVTACMRGCAYDQNKAEYAEPLYWYSAENGESFPATTIVFIHHANKEGGFRGTTALEDAVDESWSIKKPEKGETQRLGKDSRIITIGKSREGNEDKQLILRQREDLTFQLKDLVDPEAAQQDTPASVVERVLQRLRTSGKAMSLAELNSDPLVGGSVTAIKKSIQRLVDRGLVRPEGTRSARTFAAVLAPKKSQSVALSSLSRAGGPSKPVPNYVDLCGGAGSGKGHAPKSVPYEGEMSLSDLPETGRDTANSPRDTKGQKGTAVSSRGKGSQQKGQGTPERVARGDRKPEELGRLIELAADHWDDGGSPVRAMSRQEVDSSNIEAIQSILDGAPPAVVDVQAKTVQ
jgi:hypothetical protein